MVKMFFGNPSGKRNKLPVQRAPPLYDEPTIPNSTEIESPVVVEERGESLSFGASQTSQPSQESQGGFGFSS
ncbi:unnamed protein product [Brassica rapa]|uniref:Uncharacterized protein n=1 Tax=Brassica campestris TaxID=3711 RepID=A0A8D9GDI8_BRACM|nr:unnamed protein product [Brassica rapa]